MSAWLNDNAPKIERTLMEWNNIPSPASHRELDGNAPFLIVISDVRLATQKRSAWQHESFAFEVLTESAGKWTVDRHARHSGRANVRPLLGQRRRK
ncbi:MAG: hypothetical protein DME98_15980 [Verrucomicrobia bacterium]|nr:MAG: hypothetical protein DME98_15980 [Verrucomicrobiota bacterium]PYJ34980.1 MAG: hypothetical protein DME88_03255 [Verrucomicrobiota bacterium]